METQGRGVESDMESRADGDVVEAERALEQLRAARREGVDADGLVLEDAVDEDEPRHLGQQHAAVLVLRDAEADELALLDAAVL